CGMYCVDFIQEQVLDKYLPPEDVAAMFVEPIQGEGGYVVPPDDYFQRLKKMLDKNGILMVDDEVQSGMGRTGRWFGIEHWGVSRMWSVRRKLSRQEWQSERLGRSRR